MSLRFLVCLGIAMAISAHAWRNWFQAYCGMLVMTAFLEHPDIKMQLGGVPGLNIWNVMLVNILGGWKCSQRSEFKHRVTNPTFKRLVTLYLGVNILSFGRLWIDPTEYVHAGRVSLFVDYLFNPLKFLIPGFLALSGSFTQERKRMVLISLGLAIVLLGIQTVVVGGIGSSIESASRRIIRGVGYHRVELSMMLAGGFWALVVMAIYIRKMTAFLILGSALIVLMGQSMTGGRSGYVSWAVVGLTLCIIKWRKALPLIPIVGIAVIAFVPGVAERVTQGFAKSEGGVKEEANATALTSGRSDVWPLVISEIEESVIFGYGRLGMVRTGLFTYLVEDMNNDGFQHPHNAYLEQLLDNGLIGFLCVIPIYIYILMVSAKIFVKGGDPLIEAVGGICLAMTLALLVGSMGGQTLYPRESAILLWVAAGLVVRTQSDLLIKDMHRRQQTIKI